MHYIAGLAAQPVSCSDNFPACPDDTSRRPRRRAVPLHMPGTPTLHALCPAPPAGSAAAAVPAHCVASAARSPARGRSCCSCHPASRSSSSDGCAFRLFSSASYLSCRACLRSSASRQGRPGSGMGLHVGRDLEAAASASSGGSSVDQWVGRRECGGSRWLTLAVGEQRVLLVVLVGSGVFVTL